MTTITPHLSIRNANAAHEFYQKAFGATTVVKMDTPDGRIMHCSMSIDGASFYFADDFPEFGGTNPALLGGSPVTIHLQVADCNAFFARAVEAGCTVTMPLEDMFWGDRYGQLADPFGHRWSVATHLREVSPQELEQIAADMAKTGGPECGK